MAEKQLFPTFDMPEFVTSEKASEEKYRRSVYWDIEKGDFVRDGAYRLVESDGKDAFMQWCHKMVFTERYDYMAYPDYIGVEMAEALEQPTHKAVESCMERTITEALLVNPLTEYVRDFSFEWQGEKVFCTFTVKGREWDEFQLDADLDLEEVSEDDT